MDQRHLKNECVVYWIHYDYQTDIRSQGYVGITTNIKRRFKDHRRDRFRDNKLLFEIVCESTLEDCFRIERKLRPSHKIGWNIAKGGGGGREPMTDDEKIASSIQQASLYKRRPPTYREYLYSVELEFNYLTNRLSELRSVGSCGQMDERHKEILSLIKKIRLLKNGNWTNNYAGALWSKSDELYELWVSNNYCGSRTLSRLYGLPQRSKTVTNIIKQFNMGWVPLRDHKWLSYYGSYNE